MDLSSPAISAKFNEVYPKQNVNKEKSFLDDQLDWLTVDHDDLRRDILEQISTPKYHPSMSIIDAWEQETTARVRHLAFLARRALIDALDKHVIEIENRLNSLTPQLREARHNMKSFDQNDIQKWSGVLQELKQMPIFPAKIDEQNNIYELTIDLRKDSRSSQLKLNHETSITPTLTSIIHNAASSVPVTNGIEYPTIYTSLKSNTHRKSKTVKFDDNSLNRLESSIIGKTLIIKE